MALRVESGVIKFGEDWPGLFLRGDDALAYAIYLKNFLDCPTDIMSQVQMRGLVELLSSVREHEGQSLIKVKVDEPCS
jgi:hypothetical protein